MSEILNPRRNVSVSASAGSGKTWQLVSRITRLLLEGASPDHILALTFTRKAAAEMRERVEARLRELALADDRELETLLGVLHLQAAPEVRARARGLYEQLLFSPWPLRTSTLHAFCQDLVARFPAQTGVSAGFELIEAETELLECAWQSLQRKLLADSGSQASQALDVLIEEEFSESGIHRAVTQFLAQRADWRAYTHNRQDALAHAFERLSGQLQTEENPLAVLASAPFNDALETLCSSLKEIGQVQTVRAQSLLPVQDLSGESRYAVLCEALLTQEGNVRSFDPGSGVRKKLGGRTDEMTQAFKQVTATLLHLRDQKLRTATLRRTKAALTLGVAALAEFEQECRLRNCLTFTDLEWLAFKLLTSPETGPWVQYKLDQRVDHLLLDEFQDTSGTQWRLLLPLLEEMAAGNDERQRSAFIVGDIKQSIYGFRRANAELLPQATQWMQNHLDGRAETLTHSFRSTPAIITWINALFGGQNLMPGFPAHSTSRVGWGRVELAAAIQPDAVQKTPATTFRDPLNAARPDAEDARAHEEARLIAQRIRQLVEERWQIEDKGRQRALEYGDVLILIRQRTHAQALEEELARAGIPFSGETRGTLLQTLEARDLLALLRFLLSPINDLALAHTLRSPIFDATDEDLKTLAQTASADACPWYAALKTCALNPSLKRASDLLGRWLDLAQRLPVHDLLDRLCNEGNLARRYEAALPPVQAARARGNLNAVIQLALETDSGRYPSLSAFLLRLEQWVATPDAPDETPPPSASQQVRILTVHGAKGLEAPAVFLAQCATTPASKTAGWLVEWPAAEEAPTHFLLAPAKAEQDSVTRALLDLRRQREAVESMNLLYVAVTRARQFLFISGFNARNNAQGPSWHQLACLAFEHLGIAEQDGLCVFAQGEPQHASAEERHAVNIPVDARLRQPLLRPAAEPSSGRSTFDPAAARRGQAIHWLIQQISDSRDERLRGRLESQIGGVISDAEFNAWLAEARTVCTAPALQPFFDAGRYRQAWNEVALPQSDRLGIVDRLVDDGSTLWILDYKTQREGTDAALQELHRAQLEHYRQAVRRIWPDRPVRAGLVLTQEARWLELQAQ